MRSEIKFEVSGSAPLYIKNRDLGNTQVHDRGQMVGMTDGDQVYVYDTQLARDVYDLALSELRRYDLDRLLSFFNTISKGATKSFTLSIPGLAPEVGQGGTTVLSNCRFATGALRISEPDNEGYYTVEFAVFTLAEGPTGPPV